MSVQEFYRPGESVPETGVYSAIHDGHRLAHEVILRKDDIFPLCAKCGEAVRFKQLFAEKTWQQFGKYCIDLFTLDYRRNVTHARPYPIPVVLTCD